MSVRPTRVLFAQSAIRASDSTLLVNAEVEVVAAGMDTLKPRALPDVLVNKLHMTVGNTDV